MEELDRVTIERFPDAEAVARAAAELFVDIGTAAIDSNGRFAVALAGGSTPKAMYKQLARSEFDSFGWNKTVFFFGDERFVSPVSDESNFKLAYETLLQPRGIDESQIHRWQTESGPPQFVANAYQKDITAYFGEGFPRFDLVLLGMGDDGHTASLFPKTEALSENDRCVAANDVPQLSTVRLTLTVPVFNSASNVVFTVTGETKAAAAAAVFDADSDAAEFPAKLIRPAGRLFWLFDEAAAASLS